MRGDEAVHELIQNFMGDGDLEKFLPIIIIVAIILLIVFLRKDEGGIGGLLEKLPFPKLKLGE